MTDKSQRDLPPMGGAPEPDEIPREIRPGEDLPSPAPDEGGPIPDLPMGHDPLLNPGPVPMERPRPPLD